METKKQKRTHIKVADTKVLLTADRHTSEN